MLGALTGLAIVACVPQARQALTWPRMAHVAGLIVPAALVSAWFLLPTIAYESHTLIGSSYQFWRISVGQTMGIVSADQLFSLSHATKKSDFVVSLPVLAIAWVLVSMVILLLTGRRGMWMRVLMIVSGLTVLIAVVMTHAGLVLALPRPYAILQFTYRLESYVLLGLSGAVLVVLVLARGGTRRMRLWTWMLAPVLVVSVIGAIQQAHTYPHLEGRSAVFRYSKFPTNHGDIYPDFIDIYHPRVRNGRENPANIYFPPSRIHNNHISGTVHLRPGQLVYTNIAGSPELVHVTGARLVGLDGEGNEVLEVGSATVSAQTAARSAASEPTKTISVSTADSSPVVVGRLLSVGAVCVLVLELVMFAVYRRRRRRLKA